MGIWYVAETALGVLAALAVVGMVIFVLHDRLDQGRRPRVAVATFAAVALLSFCQSMLLEVDTTAGAFPNLTAAAATAALSSLGTAGAAFLGGNGFSLLPEAAGSGGLAWIAANPLAFGLHALFELANLLALALTAEFVLSLFTGFSTHLSLRQGHFGDVLIVRTTDAMRPLADRFIEEACAEGPRAPAVVLAEQGAEGADCRIMAAGHAEELPAHLAQRELACITRQLHRNARDAEAKRMPASTPSAAPAPDASSAGGADVLAHRSGRARTPRRSVYLIVFRNGRISVAVFHPDRAASWSSRDWERALDGPATAHAAADLPEASRTAPRPSELSLTAPSDLYSYSIEEIKVRQLVRQLLPANGAGIGLGLRPLHAMVLGDDVERVVLAIVYLIRNGQALDATGPEPQPCIPRIAVASAQAARIEHRLRSAYPALFYDSHELPDGTPLPTPPARFAFYTSKLDMMEHEPLNAADVTFVINTRPDTGRAPSQREVWHRILERRAPGIVPIYVQYDDAEAPDWVRENSFGGREEAHADDLKRVLLYGGTADSLQSALVLHRAIDRRAMMVNLRYADRSCHPSLFNDAANEPFLARALAAWESCSLSLYDHESSRATADFIVAERLFWEQCAAAIQGREESKVEARGRLRDLVGQLEHLRWNAYMATSGYVTRPWGTLGEDIAARLRELAERGENLDNPQVVKAAVKGELRDSRLKRHTALVDWADLPRADRAIAALADYPGIRETAEQAGCLSWLRNWDYRESDRGIAEQLEE